jgi:beta-glucanase (GH16 family)
VPCPCVPSRRASILAAVLAACGSPQELVIGRQNSAVGGGTPAGQGGPAAIAGQAGGGPTSAGAASGVMAGGSGATGAGSDPFELVLRDDFDTLDAAIWERASHTFEENRADFAPENAIIQQGKLVLSVSAKPAGSGGKDFAAAEVRTLQSFTYGKFVTRARFAAARGVVSTIFTFHDYFDAKTEPAWNEIVLEATAGMAPRLHYTSSYPNPVDPLQRVVTETFATPVFDPSIDFHEFACEWTPGYVRFSIDGAAVSELSPEPVAALTLDQRFVISVYPSYEPWAGLFEPGDLPTSAEYDWVELYAYAE